MVWLFLDLYLLFIQQCTPTVDGNKDFNRVSIFYDIQKDLFICFIDYVKLLDKKNNCGRKFFKTSKTSYLTKACCKEQFSGFRVRTVWPPFSQETKPINFATWSILESDVSRIFHSSFAVRKQAVIKFPAQFRWGGLLLFYVSVDSQLLLWLGLKVATLA